MHYYQHNPPKGSDILHSIYFSFIPIQIPRRTKYFLGTMRFEGAARHLLGIFLILVSSRQNLLQRTDAFSTPRVSNHGRGRIQQGSNSFESTWSTALKATPHDPAIRVQSPLFQQTAQPIKPIKGIAATLTKIGMMMYITSMCVALPIALFPPFLLHKMRLISKVRQEQLSLRAGQFCARWLLRLIPFCCIKTIPHKDDDPEPSIWVCNHASMLDVFMLLAADKTLRGKRKRPLKIVYVSGTQ